jgi:L-seryl-tRNA(Ser) seleniumtransferase
MGNPQAAELTGALRLLPSTDELLTTQSAAGLVAKVGRKRLTSLARQAIEEIRQELVREINTRTGRAEAYSKESLLTAAGERLQGLWESRRSSRLRKVINCTGVIIHTNLGRAPLSRDAIDAIEEAAGYTTLEFDLASGKRGMRGASVESLLTELTGAE